MAARKKSKSKKPKTPEAGQSRTIAENRRARQKFEIIEQIECGIVLKGSEVKSLRDGKVSIGEAYVRVKGKELWLVGADIAEYNQANHWNHEPKRDRKLLVHATQFNKLSQRAFEKGLTLAPLRIYFNARGIIKVLVGVCKGKKLHDKRESMKKADVKRQIDRAMRARNR